MKENKEHIIADWLENQISDQELNTLYDDRMSDDLKNIIDVTDHLEISPVDEDVLLEKINGVKDSIDRSRPILKKKKKTKTIQLMNWISGIAAIFFAVLVFSELMDTSIYTVNNTDRIITHIMPDGSKATLNSRSTMTYEEDFLSDRKVELTGEIFFQVEKGESFKVLTNNGSVTVLGTSFNVFSRDDLLSVACKTGKVMVATNIESILLPGDKVAYIKQENTIASKVEVKSINAWIKGESFFKSSRLELVIVALSRQYNIEIKYTAIDISQEFTGSFVHNDINKALKMVFLPMGIAYQWDESNNEVRLTK